MPLLSDPTPHMKDSDRASQKGLPGAASSSVPTPLAVAESFDKRILTLPAAVMVVTGAVLLYKQWTERKKLTLNALTFELKRLSRLKEFLKSGSIDNDTYWQERQKILESYDFDQQSDLLKALVRMSSSEPAYE